MHTHMISNVALLNTPFPHFIFIILDGLLNQKIISTSFFSPRNYAWHHIFLCSLYISLVVRPLSNYFWVQAFNSIKIQFAHWNLKSNVPWVGLPFSQVCFWWYQTIYAAFGYLYKHFMENLAMHQINTYYGVPLFVSQCKNSWPSNYMMFFELDYYFLI
jgi:hypothetical protein